MGNSDHPIAFRCKPKPPPGFVLSIEFQPPLLFRRFWMALEVPCAIAQMVDGGLTVEPFEFQRLINGQSDESVSLPDIFLVSPRKNSSLAAHARHSLQAAPLEMLTRPRSIFAVKESSATARFRQGAAQPIRSWRMRRMTRGLPLKAFVMKKFIEPARAMK
jgi:hypothetical protein